jgi:hypothetical protein
MGGSSGAAVSQNSPLRLRRRAAWRTERWFAAANSHAFEAAAAFLADEYLKFSLRVANSCHAFRRSGGQNSPVGILQPGLSSRCGCGLEFRYGPVAPLNEVLDSLLPSGLIPVKSQAAFGPPFAGLPVFLLLLANSHLPVGVQQWDLSPLGHKGGPSKLTGIGFPSGY